MANRQSSYFFWVFRFSPFKNKHFQFQFYLERTTTFKRVLKKSLVKK